MCLTTSCKLEESLIFEFLVPLRKRVSFSKGYYCFLREQMFKVSNKCIMVGIAECSVTVQSRHQKH